MSRIMILNDDCIKGMQSIESGTIDHVWADPPFGIKFHHAPGNYNRKHEVLAGYNEIKSANYGSFSRTWINEAFRVLKNEGTSYIFSGWTHLEHVLREARLAGFNLTNSLVWKFNFGAYTTKKFTTSHYHVLFLTKGKKYYFNKHEHYPEDVIYWKKDFKRGRKSLPTQLPVGLVEYLMKFVVKENDLILDPFVGSCPTGIVAEKLNCNLIGFEIVPAYFEFAKNRMFGINEY